MAFASTASSDSPSMTHLASSPNQSLPTISSDEFRKKIPGARTLFGFRPEP